jgi:hypothetical protein
MGKEYMVDNEEVYRWSITEAYVCVCIYIYVCVCVCYSGGEDDSQSLFREEDDFFAF